MFRFANREKNLCNWIRRRLLALAVGPRLLSMRVWAVTIVPGLILFRFLNSTLILLLAVLLIRRFLIPLLFVNRLLLRKLMCRRRVWAVLVCRMKFRKHRSRLRLVKVYRRLRRRRTYWAVSLGKVCRTLLVTNRRLTVILRLMIRNRRVRRTMSRKWRCKLTSLIVILILVVGLKSSPRLVRTTNLVKTCLKRRKWYPLTRVRVTTLTSMPTLVKSMTTCSLVTRCDRSPFLTFAIMGVRVNRRTILIRWKIGCSFNLKCNSACGNC